MEWPGTCCGRPGPRLGDSSAALAARLVGAGRAASADDRLVLPVLGTLLSGNGTDDRDTLADLDIGSVLMLPPVDDASAVALDAAPGLVRVGNPGAAVLWRVELAGSGAAPSRPARVRVLAADGTTLAALPSDGARVDTVIPAGPTGRWLVLAERADPGWHARLDGHELAPAAHAGWAQAFLLPARGGHLVVEHRGPPWIDPVRLAVLGLALLAVIPLPGRRRRLLAGTAARAAATAGPGSPGAAAPRLPRGRARPPRPAGAPHPGSPGDRAARCADVRPALPILPALSAPSAPSAPSCRRPGRPATPPPSPAATWASPMTRRRRGLPRSGPRRGGRRQRGVRRWGLRRAGRPGWSLSRLRPAVGGH